MKNVYVMCSFYCRRRVHITVIPPGPSKPWTHAALIEPEEIHEHRLKATPAQILSVPYRLKPFELKTAYHRLQKIYHPDKHTAVADFVEQAMRRRSQEINQAFAELSRDR